MKRLAYALALGTIAAMLTGQTWLVLLLGLPTVMLNHALLTAKMRAEHAPYGSIRPPAMPARDEHASADAPTLPSGERSRAKAASGRASRELRS